jgi:hypothetical protein
MENNEILLIKQIAKNTSLIDPRCCHSAVLGKKYPKTLVSVFLSLINL